MPDFAETHRSFVNTWECDENQHMNVQFYAKRFEEARRVFEVVAAGDTSAAPVRDRHIRYHAELHAGATTVTRSAVISDGARAGSVVHLLHHAETGRLSATALESAGAGFSADFRVAESEVGAALPRSVEAEPLRPLSARHLVSHGGLATNFSIAAANDCDAEGRLTARAIVGRFSDGAPHGWKASGVDVNWLLENGLGRVAVEMKITRHGECRPGDALALYTMPAASSGKTVTLHHELVRLSDGLPLATGKVVALILDLSTRRPTALPEAVVAKLQGQVRPD